MKEVNLVTTEGNDPTCPHFELIEDLIGMCKWCGRVKDYNKLPSKEKMMAVTIPPRREPGGIEE